VDYIQYDSSKHTNRSVELGAMSNLSGEKVKIIQAALTAIDSRHERELSKLEQSGADEDLKDFIKNDILSKHNEMRLRYVKALEDSQS
jgi:hypothetical protein